MKEYERKQLLERIDRDGATVGVRIPERVELQGEPFALRDFVFEIKRLDAVPQADRERVERAKKQLRRERLARRQTIEEGEVSYEAGERLAETVLGIDRALNALSSLEPTDLEAEASAQDAADRKRWLNFLNQVLDRDDGGRPRA
ncbi:MAG: DUF5788 family protein [Halobacteriales archaeon]